VKRSGRNSSGKGGLSRMIWYDYIMGLIRESGADRSPMETAEDRADEATSIEIEPPWDRDG